MRMTKREKKICKEYGAEDKDGNAHCYECPLVIDSQERICYATIDGSSPEAKMLRRY